MTAESAVTDWSAVEFFVRRLISEVNGDTGCPEIDGPLLDVVIDGVRCVLVRSSGSRSATSAIMLSPREQEVAQMVAQGYPNKAIASSLNISSWTVSSYLRRLFNKLGVSSRAAMVARLSAERVLTDETLNRAISNENRIGDVSKSDEDVFMITPYVSVRHHRTTEATQRH